MIRTKRAAQAWVQHERIVVTDGAQGYPYSAAHPGYPTIVVYGRTYIETVAALAVAIDDERASDARARESEIPW